MTDPEPRDLRREHCDDLSSATTRWADNDMLGHLNNAVYLELFDTAINAWMEPAAHCEWVQVYIGRESRRPVPIPAEALAVFERCLAARTTASEGDGA